MAPTRRSSTQIQHGSLEQASTMLRDLPDKPRENWSLREAIHLLKDTIYGTLDRGYSYEEVADVLSERGIKISPSSLKSYLASSRKASGEPTGRRRGRRRKSEEGEEVTPEETATPKTRQRRPRSTAASAKNSGPTPIRAEKQDSEEAEPAAEPVSSTRRGRRKANA